MANAEQQNQNNNLRRLETDPDTELCPDGQLWCCAPTNPNAATYDLASTKGCMDLMSLGSQCEGYGAEFYRQLCSCVMSNNTQSWEFDCDDDICRARDGMEPNHNSKTSCEIVAAVTGFLQAGLAVII